MLTVKLAPKTNTPWTGILAVILLMGVPEGQARTRHVFFAGGQSNAKPEWAAAIEATLKAAAGTNVQVIHYFHPGDALEHWYTTGPQDNYATDFFNAAGTGYLQTQLQAILSAHDDYVFNGFFWFQGEGDTGAASAMDAYTNRFFGMLTRLRQDLGQTDAIRFNLAVIDLNPDPFYDIPANAVGRTRADIERMRSIQFAMSFTNAGSRVDSRGYARTDAWHITSPELTRLGTAMGQAFVTVFGLAWAASALPLVNGSFEAGTDKVATGWNHEDYGTVSIPSDASDGAVFERTTASGTGAFPGQDLIAGSAAGPANYSGIALFPLPSQSFGTGALSLTVAVGGVLSNVNIDVWGLGYVTGSPQMNPAWILHADTDLRTGFMLGTGIGASTPTKIADNIVPQGTVVSAGTRWQTDAAQGSTLVSFLNSLYASGAKQGDYAVIRVNPDANVATNYDGTAGHEFQSIRYGGSHRTTPDQRARLRLGFCSSQIIAERSIHTPRTGTNSFRFGLDATHHGTNVSWITQELNTSDISAHRVTLTGYARHNSDDPLLPGQQIEFQFLCKNAGGDILSVANTTALTPVSPPDVYQPSVISAAAPTGTVSVAVQVLFHATNYLSQTSGTAYVDDLELSVSPVPEPDFRITEIRQLNNGDLALKWASISNRRYVVQATTNLSNTAFTDLSSNITASAAETAFTNHPSARAQFYRVQRLP